MSVDMYLRKDWKQICQRMVRRLKSETSLRERKLAMGIELLERRELLTILARLDLGQLDLRLDYYGTYYGTSDLRISKTGSNLVISGTEEIELDNSLWGIGSLSDGNKKMTLPLPLASVGSLVQEPLIAPYEARTAISPGHCRETKSER